MHIYVYIYRIATDTLVSDRLNLVKFKFLNAIEIANSKRENREMSRLIADFYPVCHIFKSRIYVNVTLSSI